MFFKKKPEVYDRRKLLDEAERARLRGKRKKAIAGYRKILDQEPNDAVIHGKLAPLLAQSNQREEALRSFHTAATAYSVQGFEEKALSMFLQAAEINPHDPELWLKVAEGHAKRQRKADAVAALMVGAGHSRKTQPSVAIALLERAVGYDGLHLDATVSLAKLLGKDGRKADGLRLLHTLSTQLGGKAQRKIRAAQLSLSFTPRNLFRYLGSVLAR